MRKHLKNIHTITILQYSRLNTISQHYDKKEEGVQPSDEPKSCTPVLCLWEVCETEPFSLHIGKATATREIIKAPAGKTDTGDHFAVFPPLSPQFLERLER